MLIIVYSNNDKTSLIINCNCGCGDGIEIRIGKDENEYVWLHILASKWYADQETVMRRIGLKLKKIWWVIRGKDYFHSEILMSRVEWIEFLNIVNEVEESTKNL